MIVKITFLKKLATTDHFSDFQHFFKLVSQKNKISVFLQSYNSPKKQKFFPMINKL
jgi:hypothetical protein